MAHNCHGKRNNRAIKKKDSRQKEQPRGKGKRLWWPVTVTVSFLVKLKFYFSKLIFFFPKPRFFSPQKPPSFSLNSGFSTKPRFVFPQNLGFFFFHNPTLRHTPQAILSRAHRSPPSDVQDGGRSKVIPGG